jgi:hypothetical protein
MEKNLNTVEPCGVLTALQASETLNVEPTSDVEMWAKKTASHANCGSPHKYSGAQIVRAMVVRYVIIF